MSVHHPGLQILIHSHVCVCAHARAHALMCACLCVCVCVCVCVCIVKHVRVSVCVWLCACVCDCVCVSDCVVRTIFFSLDMMFVIQVRIYTYIYISVAGKLQCVAVWCSVLKCVAVCYTSLPPQDIVESHALHTTLSCRCVAVCCSVLQCVAVCCIVLYIIATPRSRVVTCTAHHAL